MGPRHDRRLPPRSTYGQMAGGLFLISLCVFLSLSGCCASQIVSSCGFVVYSSQWLTSHAADMEACWRVRLMLNRHPCLSWALLLWGLCFTWDRGSKQSCQSSKILWCHSRCVRGTSWRWRDGGWMWTLLLVSKFSVHVIKIAWNKLIFTARLTLSYLKLIDFRPATISPVLLILTSSLVHYTLFSS